MAAHLAYRLGISLPYAAQKFEGDEPGDFWYGMAEFMERELADEMDRQWKELNSPTTEAIY